MAMALLLHPLRMRVLLATPALLLLLLCFHPAAALLPPQPPNFSWETLPVFMHSGNSSGPLSSATAKFMSRFPIVTVAGFNGHWAGTNEAAVGPDAKLLKVLNSSIRVLHYQNTLINFPQTNLGKANTTLPESLLLHDKRGRLVYLGGCGSHHAAPNHTVYDHRQPAMREAWVDNVVQVVLANHGLVDGVFCDRSGPITAVLTKDLFCYDFAPGFAAEWDRGHWQSVADTQAALAALIPTAIVIGNHASPQAFMKLKAPNSSWNAKMYEHYTPTKLPTMDYTPDGSQLAAFKKDGPLFIDEVHVDNCRVDMPNRTAGGESEHMDTTTTMYRSSLAAFLIGASEYSYYACTEGWGYADGWQHWSPDYDRPVQSKIRVPLFAARTLNATAPSRVSLSLR